MAKPNFDRLYPKTQGEWTGKKKPPTEHEKKAQAVPQKELHRVKGNYDRSRKRVDRAKAAAQAVKAERAKLHEELGTTEEEDDPDDYEADPDEGDDNDTDDATR